MWIHGAVERYTAVKVLGEAMLNGAVHGQRGLTILAVSFLALT